MPPAKRTDDQVLPSDRIADDLRQAIRNGAIAPGEKVPSERDLAARYDVARNTVRAAVRRLAAEGLVISRQGAGVVVRHQGPIQRVAFDRYRQVMSTAADTAERGGLKETAFTRDHGIGWAEYDLHCEFDEVPAGGTVAELLDIESGTPVLARHFVFHVRGEPRQLSVSHLPLDLVAGTPVADPSNEPWPGGTIAQLETLGTTVTRVEESVRSRMPTANERVALAISKGVPVLTVTRRMLADGRPVEAAVDIVMPADRFVLDYAIDL